MFMRTRGSAVQQIVWHPRSSAHVRWNCFRANPTDCPWSFGVDAGDVRVQMELVVLEAEKAEGDPDELPVGVHAPATKLPACASALSRLAGAFG